MKKNVIKKLKGPLLTTGACLLIIAAGILGMTSLASSRKAPPHKPELSKGLAVSAVPLEITSVRLKASGYGQAAVVNVQEICPRVSGNIVQKHATLEEGAWWKRAMSFLKLIIPIMPLPWTRPVQK